MNNKANILEIFSSVQGEGCHIGERQIFIRFHGCNLKCAFCDVKANKKGADVEIKDVFKEIDKLNADRIHNTLTLTGGEPLLHSRFLEQLLPGIIDRGLKVYLETNGTLSCELENIIDYIDIIAVDIKLPSVSKNKPYWQEHREFLKVAFKKEFFVKVVVSGSLSIEDFDEAVELMRSVSFDIPFIIQPETKPDSCQLNIDSKLLLKLQGRALKTINHVLVIPQAHKMMGVK